LFCGWKERDVSGTAEKTTRMADEPGLAKQNGTTIGRVMGSGNVGHVEEKPDGTMHATIRINEDELIFDPGILIMPHGGTLELDLYNDDKNTHCAVLPCNGHSKFIWMVNHSHGTATLDLDGPGQYFYGSTTGNDEGRGLTGSIVVSGDAPPEAKLDRPAQPQP
jgi:PQQ system protein